jgi:hypothetical protein
MADLLNCLGPPTAPTVQTNAIHCARRGLSLAAAADGASLLLWFPFRCFFDNSSEADILFSPFCANWFTLARTVPDGSNVVSPAAGRFRSGVIEERDEELLDFLFLGSTLLSSPCDWNNCLFAVIFAPYILAFEV